MKCEINFEANQVDESSFYRRDDSDGQIPALVPCQGKVDRIKLRRLLDSELAVDGNLRGAVDSQVTTQISRSFLLYSIAEIFENAQLVRRFYSTFGNWKIVTISKQAGSHELCRWR